MQVALQKGDVMMCLAMAGLNRDRAASLGGVSPSTFARLMRRYRVQAPRANTKLNPDKVRRIRSLLEKHTQEEVAEIMQVHHRTIGMVERRETWYWVR